MGFILPEGTPWGVQILFWGFFVVIGLLFAGLIFFIARYINKNDEHHKSVEGKLKKQSEEFDDLADKLGEGVQKIDKAAVEMEKTQTKFQREVSKELMEIHKVTGDIRTDLVEGRSKVGEIKKDLETLSETVAAHHKSLGLGAKAMHQQRQDLVNMKTVVVKLSEDMRILKSKKEDKK